MKKRLVRRAANCIDRPIQGLARAACRAVLVFSMTSCAGLSLKTADAFAKTDRCTVEEVRSFLDNQSRPFLVETNKLANYLGRFPLCRVKTTRTYSITVFQTPKVTTTEDVVVETFTTNGKRSGCVDRYTRFVPPEHFRYCYQNNALVESN